MSSSPCTHVHTASGVVLGATHNFTIPYRCASTLRKQVQCAGEAAGKMSCRSGLGRTDKSDILERPPIGISRRLATLVLESFRQSSEAVSRHAAWTWINYARNASEDAPSSNLPSANLNLDLYESSHAPHHLPLRVRLGFLPPIRSGLLCMAAQRAFPRHLYLTRRSCCIQVQMQIHGRDADPAVPKPASLQVKLTTVSFSASSREQLEEVSMLRCRPASAESVTIVVEDAVHL